MAVLAGTPFDLPSRNSESTIPGSAPAIASAGTETVVIWHDTRTEGLFGNVERTRMLTRDFWWNRARANETLAARPGIPGCQTVGGHSFAVTVNQMTGTAYAGWLEEAAPGTWALQLATLQLDGGTRCEPAQLQRQGTGDAGALSLGWTGTKFFAAWRVDSSAMVTWCEAVGGCGPVGSLQTVLASERSLAGAADSSGKAHLLGTDGVGTWEVRIIEGNLSAPPSVSPDPASAVVLDPFDQVVGRFDTAWSLSGPYGMQTPFGSSPLRVVSLTTTNISLYVYEGGSTATAILPTNQTLVSPPFEAADQPALTREGARARMAFVSGGSVWTRALTASSFAAAATDETAIAVARPPQRRPSIAWAQDRWLVVSEEWTDAGWAPLVTPVFPDAGLGSIQASVLAGFESPELVTAPDGGLFVRLSAANSTETRRLLVDGGVVSLGPVALTTSRTTSGTVTNSKVVHWSNNFIASIGSFDGGLLATSSAVLPGGVAIPVRVSPSVLSVGYLGDFASSPTVQPPQMATADLTAPIAIASTFDGRGWVVLLGWYSGAALELRSFSSDAGMLTSFTRSAPLSPNRGLAMAALGRQFAVVTRDDRVTLFRVDPNIGIMQTVRLNAVGELPGDPVLAVAPTGQVAVAWPALDPVHRSVAIRLNILDPPEIDGGVDGGAGGGAAGGSAAGGPAGGGAAGGGAAGGDGGGTSGGGTSGGGAIGGGTSGGGTTGGGTTGGGTTGGGTTGGGTTGGGTSGGEALAGGRAGGPAFFTPTSCGCTSAPELSWLLGLGLGALARRRTPRR